MNKAKEFKGNKVAKKSDSEKKEAKQGILNPGEKPLVY